MLTFLCRLCAAEALAEAQVATQRQELQRKHFELFE